ncbi:MAG: alpha/beta hydrolase [Pseudomonadota bacterium]
MSSKIRCFLSALTFVITIVPTAQAKTIDASNYNFPLTNPFEATIATTPDALLPLGLPANRNIDQDDYELNLRPEREFSLPDNFWAVKKLKYRIARQPGPAPLIFLIAGTGSNYSSGTMDFLKKVFYRDGYHVVQLSSPTSYDFMVGASRYATPGYSPEDARDLYTVMKAVREQQANLAVTDFHLLGYSLGGLDAAFVSQLDDAEKVFAFKRVLLLNPPVNLQTSVNNLDSLVQTEVKGVNDDQTFYDLIFTKLATFFRAKGHIQMDAAMLYDFQQSPQRLNDEALAMLIGTAFRFSAADIVFTSDLLNRRGGIVPPDTIITESSSLTPYFQASLRCNFACYIDRQLLPFWRQRFGGTDMNQLIHDSSLYALADYLHNSQKIGVMTNADDLILGPGDLRFLRKTFGQRLTIYPQGGHLGNLNYRVNVGDMLEFFHE